MFSVLIDTSAYEDLRFSFQGKIFETLKRLNVEGKILILSSDVIRKEIRSHLQDAIRSSINIIQNASKKTHRLVQGDLGVLSEQLNHSNEWKKDLLKIRMKRIDNFFNSINYEDLDSSVVNINKIIDDYFEKRAPFGEGRKKHEFPDAFVLNSFLQTNAGNLNRTCLVSKDADWHNFASENEIPHIFPSISEFIDFIHANYDADFVEQLKLKLDSDKDNIAKIIKDEIKDIVFEVSDSWIDAETEINSETLEIEILDFNIISFSSHTASLEANTNVSFHAYFSAEDETAYYKDDETKEWIYLGRNDYMTKVDKQVTANITLSYETHPQAFLDLFEIEEVSLPEGFDYLDTDELGYELMRHWNESYY